jgi:hypothetical protein
MQASGAFSTGAYAQKNESSSTAAFSNTPYRFVSSINSTEEKNDSQPSYNADEAAHPSAERYTVPSYDSFTQNNTPEPALDTSYQEISNSYQAAYSPENDTEDKDSIDFVCDAVDTIVEPVEEDEDYYTDYKMASASRLLRIICFLLSITVPGLYLAVTSFHIRLLPPAFALSIAAARQGVPFSPTAEALLIIFVFETLKEAGLRMPQSVGHALSIVGGLVVGQAAVEAKIISAPMLIAVALSGIAGLMVPRLRTAVFISRIAITVLSAIFGIYGTLSFLVLLLAHILSIRSFGRDYTESLRSLSRQSQKDTFIRSRWSSMIKRPKIQNRDEKRQNEKNN